MNKRWMLIQDVLGDENREAFFEVLFDKMENRHLLLFQKVMRSYKNRDELREEKEELKESFQEFIRVFREVTKEKKGKFNWSELEKRIPFNTWFKVGRNLESDWLESGSKPLNELNEQENRELEEELEEWKKKIEAKKAGLDIQ